MTDISLPFLIQQRTEEKGVTGMLARIRPPLPGVSGILPGFHEDCRLPQHLLSLTFILW